MGVMTFYCFRNKYPEKSGY